MISPEAVKNEYTYAAANRFGSNVCITIAGIFGFIPILSMIKIFPLTMTSFTFSILATAIISRAALKNYLNDRFDENGNPKT